MPRKFINVKKNYLKKGALNILEFLYVCKKAIDILVAVATVFEEKTTKLLAKITKKEKK